MGPVLVLAGVAVASCGKNATRLDGSGPPPTTQPAGPVEPMANPHTGAMMGGPPGAQGAPVPEWTIAGTIQVAPEFAGKAGASDVLFVMARVPGQHMPVAVERFAAPTFPLAYTLRSGHAAGQAGGPPQQLEVLARLSRSGTAGPPQPGDLEGVFDGQASPGATGIDFVVGKQY